MTEKEFLERWKGMSSRERDELVAEKVMGWGKWEWGPCAWGLQGGLAPGWNWSIAGNDGVHVAHWNPSTDIASAWQVVEKLGTHIGLLIEPKVMEGRYGANLEHVLREPGRTRCTVIGNPPTSCWGGSAPEAICLAALLAGGVE